MKTRLTLASVIFLTIAMHSMTGYSQNQAYYYSGAVGGGTAGNPGVEVALAPSDGSGSFFANFGTISETFYYNPAAQTLETVGSITLSPSIDTFNIYNGPGIPIASATLTVGNSGSVSFDYTSSIGQFSGYGILLYIPVSAGGSYQGQPFSGSWNLEIGIGTEITAASPTSITFSEYSGSSGPNGDTLADFPSQGVIESTPLPLEDGTDGVYSYNFDVNSAVATAVPEPKLTILFGAGFATMVIIGRIRNLNPTGI